MRPTLPLRRPQALACQTALCLSLAFSFALPQEVRAQGLSTTEVWASWQEAVAATGGSLNATEKREGMRVTLSDIVLRPTAEPLPALHLQELSLMGQADGSVALQLPASVPLRLEVPLLEGSSPAQGQNENDLQDTPPSSALTFNLETPQMQFVILGLGLKPEVMVSAPTISVKLDTITPPLPENSEVDFEFALQNLGLRYKHDLASDTPSFDTAWRLGEAAITFTGMNPQATFSHIWNLSEIEASGLAKFPPSSRQIAQGPSLAERLLGQQSAANLQALALLKALHDGMVIDLKAKLGGVQIALNGTTEDQTSHAGLSLQNAKATLGLNKEGFSTQISVVQPDLKTLAPLGDGAPQSIAFSAQELGASLSFDLMDLRRPQNWSLGLTSRELQADDTAWAAFDPSSTLPRTPMTFVWDSKGSFLLNPDFLAPPNLLPPLPDAPPSATASALNRFDITLSQLQAQGMGVALQGQGALEFDFQKPLAFGPLPLPLPLPQGKASFSYEGIATLIEHLATMGLLSPQQAIQARLSLPMIGKAAEGSDSFTSELDFRDDSLYLNGNKIR